MIRKRLYQVLLVAVLSFGAIACQSQNTVNREGILAGLNSINGKYCGYDTEGNPVGISPNLDEICADLGNIIGSEYGRS